MWVMAFVAIAAAAALPSVLRRARTMRSSIRPTASYSSSTTASDASAALSRIVSVARTAKSRIVDTEPLQMTTDEVNHVTELLERVDATALALEFERFTIKPGGIAYVEVGASPAATLAVFILADGMALPLHNHPGMFVFTKVLWGKLGVDSFDLLPDGLARRNEPQIVEQGKSIVLNPTERNVHSFSAVQGPVALFDIVCPPYGEDRPCSYMQPLENVDVGQSVRLKNIPTPPDLYMVSFGYHGVKFSL